MNRSSAGWMVAALLVGAWLLRGTDAHADPTPTARVVCNTFYVAAAGTREKHDERVDELVTGVSGWLTEQFRAGAVAVQFRGAVGWGAIAQTEVVCVLFP